MTRSKRMIKLICTNDGKVIELPAWDVRRRRQQGNQHFFCNRKCYNKYRQKTKATRIRKMKKLRFSKDGSNRFTLKEIGERFGVTPQRVHAILKEAE